MPVHIQGLTEVKEYPVYSRLLGSNIPVMGVSREFHTVALGQLGIFEKYLESVLTLQ